MLTMIAALLTLAALMTALVAALGFKLPSFLKADVAVATLSTFALIFAHISAPMAETPWATAFVTLVAGVTDFFAIRHVGRRQERERQVAERKERERQALADRNPHLFCY